MLRSDPGTTFLQIRIRICNPAFVSRNSINRQILFIRLILITCGPCESLDIQRLFIFNCLEEIQLTVLREIVSCMLLLRRCRLENTSDGCVPRLAVSCSTLSSPACTRSYISGACAQQIDILWV